MTKSVESPTGRVESAGASARQGAVDRHLRRPTSSLQAPLPAPRRTPGGGGGSPPRRQHRNEATTGLLRGYYEGYYEATTRSTKGLLRGYYKATTRLLGGLPRGYYKATTRLLRGYHHRSRTCTYCALGPFYFIGHPYILFITLITRSCTSIRFAYSPHGSLLDRTPSTLAAARVPPPAPGGSLDGRSRAALTRPRLGLPGYTHRAHTSHRRGDL
jgi:hypothetical protein